jgi:hypothetical protein
MRKIINIYNRSASVISCDLRLFDSLIASFNQILINNTSQDVTGTLKFEKNIRMTSTYKWCTKYFQNGCSDKFQTKVLKKIDLINKKNDVD